MFSLHPKHLHLFLYLVLNLCSDLRGLATYRISRKKNKMAGVMRYAKGLILLVTVSTLLGVGLANRPIAGSENRWWKWNTNNTYVGGGGGPGNNNWGYNMPNRTTTVNVGGSDNTWTFGFNYAEWAFRNGPFYLNDTLVFKYDPPSNTTGSHSVYLFRDFWSYRSCNLKRAKMIGSVTQGGGEGFKFVLKDWKPYYFACGEHAPIHCKLGKMKFMVMPFPRYRPED